MDEGTKRVRAARLLSGGIGRREKPRGEPKWRRPDEAHVVLRWWFLIVRKRALPQILDFPAVSPVLVFEMEVTYRGPTSGIHRYINCTTGSKKERF